MTEISGPTSSRHLVDPELLALAETFPLLDLDQERLPLIRAAMAARPPASPTPAELHPDVVMQEHHVPGFGGGPDVRVLRYERRDRSGTAPALVWMHGGGFVLGTAEVDDRLCRRIVDATGAVVVSVDYRTAPENQAPGLVHDCYAALRWVHAEADVLDVDRDAVAVGGASAGGGLAASLAILARDLAEVPVSFQALVYPMLDDRTGAGGASNPFAGHYVWPASDNQFGWSAHLGGPAGGDEVSPYAAAGREPSVAGLPAAFIAVGSLDLFVDEDIDYATRLIRAGVLTELHVYPGAFHAFDQVLTATATQALFTDLTRALERSWQRPEAPTSDLDAAGAPVAAER